MPAVVLLTGASGFLGRAIAPHLAAAGHHVIGIDPMPAPDPAVRHVVDDLGDRARLAALLAAEQVTHIIHAGGVSGPMVLPDAPERVMDINVGRTLNLLQAALATGVATFVYCSSVSAVGDFYQAQPIGEDFPLRPTSPYGASKAAVEMMLRALWRKVPLDLCVLRFTTIYGPGRQTQSVIDDIVAAALAGRDAHVEPATDWPYVYVDDAAQATVAAAFCTPRRQLAYYVAYPEQVALAQLAAAASQPHEPVRLVIDETRRQAARGPLDIAPARRDFGFAPQVDHREGIRRMVAAAGRRGG
jgi:nucleoside-diphosphate-sugar epimerase